MPPNYTVPSVNTKTGDERPGYGLKGWVEKKLGTYVFDGFIAPGIEHSRSTILHAITFGLPLIIAYLHSGEQLTNLLASMAKVVVGAADNKGTFDEGAAYTQLIAITGIIRGWFTHDAQVIENSGIPTAP